MLIYICALIGMVDSGIIEMWVKYLWVYRMEITGILTFNEPVDSISGRYSMFLWQVKFVYKGVSNCDI